MDECKALDDGANMLLMLGELGANLAGDSGAVDGDDSDEDESYSKVGHTNITPHTPLIYPSHTPHTPLIYPSYTPHTPLTHPLYAPDTSLMHPSHTPHTPLMHPSLTPHTPITHPFYFHRRVSTWPGSTRSSARQSSLPAPAAGAYTRPLFGLT